MSIVVSDLIARVRSEGVEQTAAAVKQVSANAAEASRALQIMAEQAAKAAPTQGNVAQILELFQRTNVQPTVSALAQAREEMQRTAAAAAQTVAPVQATARAATDHAAAARSGAQAVRQVADGWNLSESSAVRFGTALVGINLGISLVAGAARLIHDAIADTVTAQLDWERSLVQVRAIYGDLAPRVVALSQAQAALPGVTSSQTELTQANIAAGFLTTRYGLSPGVTGTLTTQAARLGGLLFPGGDQEAQRSAIQSAVIQYARSGSGTEQLEALTGQPYDPLTLARRLGFSSEAALQGLTPQQLVAARGALESANLAQANIQGAQQNAGLLSTQRNLQHNLEQAQAQLQQGLEDLQAPQPPTDEYGRTQFAQQTNFPALGSGRPAYAGNSLVNVSPEDLDQAAAAQQAARQTAAERVQAYQKAVDDARAALDANSADVVKNSIALADNQKQLDAANATLAKFGVEMGSATFRLLSFTGSLEDMTSIARGDVAAQAQSAVAARGRSAIPGIGTPAAEINFQATQTAYAQAYQNFVAQQAQQTSDNAIQEYLTRVSTTQGPQQQAAQRALDEAQRAQPVQQALGEAQRTSAQLDFAAAERQAQLDQISLDQRTRYVQMLRDTVELRLRDNSLQQDAIRASADVIRAQQAALPSQQIGSAAQYQQNLAQAYAQQRMARVIQGQSVAGLPSIDQLIQMNVGGQLAAAENAPGLVQGQRGVEVAQQGATVISLQDALVQSSIRLAELKADTDNLKEIPTQSAYQLELVTIQRSAIAVQAETRDYMKQLVEIMTRNGGGGGGGGLDLGSLIFGEGGDVPAPQMLPGARRGPS